MSCTSFPSDCVCAASVGRLKVNMANIYFKQKNYPKAIKFYRMALDQISNAHKEMRIKIMQNIGVVFVRMGQYSDAITSFEHIMSESPNIRTGFNLILCYYAIGDRERMKKAFQKLIAVPLGIDDEDKYIPSNVRHTNMYSTVHSDFSSSALLLENSYRIADKVV